MGARLSKSTENENDSYSQCSSKCSNLQKEKIDTAEEERTTKITDFPNECLFEIFGHLDIQDLFNVAVANERLRPAAAEVYKSKARGKRISLADIEYAHFDNTCIQAATEFFKVRGFRTWLLYLRYFGSSINKLNIIYGHHKSNRKWHKYVNQYVNTYCVESLNEIEFLYMSKVTIDQFVKPFTNVHIMCLAHCNFGKHLPRFAKWFPNVRRLTFLYVRIAGGYDWAYLKREFPQLDWLGEFQ